MDSHILARLSDKKDPIAIVGLGYVGLPLACLLAKKFRVVGFDIDSGRVEELRRGYDRTREVPEPETLLARNISYTDRPECLGESPVIIVTVPTPVDRFKIPDLSPLLSASRTISEHMRKGTVVVYESTVYPGCTENDCRQVLEANGLKYQVDFHLAYSPERVNPGDREHTIERIKKVVSASSPEVLELVTSIYGSVIEGGIHTAPNIATAEAAKVIENTQRDLNVALINELAMLFDRLGLDTQDVLAAAGTKWNFLPFTPGLVGGHCYSGKHTLTLVNHGHHKIRSFETYWNELVERKKGRVLKVGDTEIIKPLEPIQTLSFDRTVGKAVLAKVAFFSKSGSKPGLKITTGAHHSIEITSKHPMVIDESGEWFVKLAENVVVGDRIPLLQDLPSRDGIRTSIDLIGEIPTAWHSRYRVKRKAGTWREIKDVLQIKKNTGKKASNFYNLDYLPLEVFLKLEASGFMPVARRELMLVSGRGGGSFQMLPAVIPITPDLARLVGYYLSEGCISHDGSARVCFTFNRSEHETIADCSQLLKGMGLHRLSIYQDKTFQATTIKASSELLSFLLETILNCGVRSEDARIPEEMLYGSQEIRWNVLKGLLCGDGGVKFEDSRRPYVKNGKKYSHRRKITSISYFSISPELIHGVELLFMNFAISFNRSKRDLLLEVHGTENLEKLYDCFLDSKKKKLAVYLTNKVRFPRSKIFERYRGYVTAPIKKIEQIVLDTVYSLEVEGTHAVVTDGGIITHNCIGVDPYYLTHVAKGLGFHPQLVLAGRRINDSMGAFVAQKTMKLILNHTQVGRDKLKVAVLGMTFKENVPDLRNTKVVDVVQSLEEFGVKVFCVDPVCYEEEFHKEYQRTLTKWEEVPVCDAIIGAVRHKEFVSGLSWDSILAKLSPAKLLVDLKGIFDRQEAETRGIKLWRL
ncbi:MAG: nucleotide sugar dehydrogenase [Deltaproteobacteria bacterium]|nr:nucleotide sugar dehydrogenase [Deltaproteobacteria bacterium]